MNSLTTPLGSVVRVQKGKPPLPTQDDDDRLPVLTPSLLRQQSSAEEFGSRKRGTELRDGELLCLWDGSNAGEFFRAIPGLLPSTMVRILCHDARINPGFLFLALKSHEARLKSLTAGTGIPHVDKATFNAIPIPRLEPHLQMAVVGAIDLISNLIQLLEQKIAKQERVRAGLLQALLTRGIDENGEIRELSDGEFQHSPCGKVPRSWTCKPLGVCFPSPFLGTTRRGGTAKGITLVKMGCLGWGRISLTQTEPVFVEDSELSKIQLRDGDILFNTRNTPELVGKSGRWELGNGFVPDNNILVLRPPAEIDSRMLVAYLNCGTGRRSINDLATGTTSVAAIYWRDLSRLNVPLPQSAAEASAIGDVLSEVDAQTIHLNRLLRKLGQVKTGLMRDLLSGRVSVEPLLDLPPFSSEKVDKP